MQRRDFVLANTSLAPCRNVQEVMLYQANEVHDLWHKTQRELDELDVAPPFWAFAWAGGEALAQFILDNPQYVQGKRILDFASGSGLVAIAAKKAGALDVTANDIDVFAVSAIKLNAAINNVEITMNSNNMIERDDAQNQPWDVVLAGDIFYDKAMSYKVTPWLENMAKRGVTVLCGDPERAYVPHELMIKRASFTLDVSMAIEDRSQKQAHIWQFLPNNF